jgi:hypothetical protein
MSISKYRINNASADMQLRITIDNIALWLLIDTINLNNLGGQGIMFFLMLTVLQKNPTRSSIEGTQWFSDISKQIQ